MGLSVVASHNWLDPRWWWDGERDRFDRDELGLDPEEDQEECEDDEEDEEEEF